MAPDKTSLRLTVRHLQRIIVGAIALEDPKSPGSSSYKETHATSWDHPPFACQLPHGAPFIGGATELGPLVRRWG